SPPTNSNQPQPSQPNSNQPQPSQPNSNQPQPSQPNSNQPNQSQPSPSLPNPNSGDVQPTSSSPPPHESSNPPMPSISQKKIPLNTHYTSTADVCSTNPYCKTDTNKQDSGKTETTQEPDTITTIMPAGYDSRTITSFTKRTVTVTVTVYVPGYVTTVTEYKNGETISYETYYPPSTKIIVQVVTSVAPAGFEFVESKARRLSHYGLFDRNNDGLVSVVLSLWVVMWSLVYLIL
ncbi:33768_t:CDS:2, partial [Racocetra persica]